MVEHEICLLSWSLGHIGHLKNTGMATEANESISRRSLSIMYSFALTSANIVINDISQKLDSLGNIFVETV